MTPTSTPTRQGRPDTLPRDDQSSRRNVGAGIAAVIGSLLLLIGVPIALVLLVGNPLPTTPPSRDWLTATIDGELVINVLAVLVWLVWVHFVVCFLSEWRAIRRGRMPDHVVLGGGSQLIARRLVAGVLMLSGGLGLAHGLASAAADAGPVNATETTSAVTAGQVDRNLAGPAAIEAQVEATPAAVQGTKHYEVVPPQGRHHDTMWDISERLLGDPMRYREIYELNKNRMQPDGRRITDADLIRPGYQLLLPADAKGPGVLTTPPPSSHLTAGDPSGAGLVAQGRVDAGATAGTTRAGGTTTQLAAPDQGSDAPASRIEWLLLGGGLILAGALRAITAQRGPFGEPDGAAGELAAAAAVRRAEFLDLALRGLSESRAAQSEPMPDLQFVYVNDEQVVLHVMGAATAPESPWTVGEDGRSWSLRQDDLAQPGTGATAPYPSLVNVATTHGFDILVDLELAPGLVAIGGDTGVARDVAMAMALDLTTHAWSDSLEVAMVGFGEHLADLDTGRARTVDNLDELLAEVDATQAAQGSVLAQLGVHGVLQGRQHGAASDCSPLVVFLSGSPSAEQAQRLSRLTTGGRTSFSVVCVGDSPSARWRFVVDAAGHFESTAIGVSGEARRLNREAQRQLRELLEQAVAGRVAADEVFENTSPAAFAADAAPALALMSGASVVSDVTSAPVAVRLLGPVRVDGPGQVEEARRGLLTELVVMAALHPEGVHPAVLRSSLWPRGVEDDVVEARISDAQAWLGTDDDGRPRLVVDDDGRVRVAASVANDYAVLVQAAQAGGQGGSEIEGLLHALTLGTGEVFSGAGRGYSWLTFAREARQGRLLTASVARRAADLAVAAGRFDVAAGALAKGLVMVPTCEALWRTLLRLQAQHAPAEVEGTINQMYSALQGHGVKHEPETEALVIELAPGRERVRGA